MFLGMNHVGLVVKSIDETLEVLKLFGAEEKGRKTIPERGQTSCMVRLGSGMFELGWELKPHDAIPWVIDLGAIGWIGQQKGLTFHAKVKKSF